MYGVLAVELLMRAGTTYDEDEDKDGDVSNRGGCDTSDTITTKT